jgi:hypothetical protein
MLMPPYPLAPGMLTPGTTQGTLVPGWVANTDNGTSNVAIPMEIVVVVLFVVMIFVPVIRKEKGNKRGSLIVLMWSCCQYSFQHRQPSCTRREEPAIAENGRLHYCINRVESECWRGFPRIAHSYFLASRNAEEREFCV